MTEKEAAMIPFHALNEFMRPDFRMSVVRSTLNALPDLPDEYRIAIDKLVKKTVRIPGFRNSGKAPTALKAGPLVQTFEKNPQMVAAVLTAWAEINAPLRQQIYDMLENAVGISYPSRQSEKSCPAFSPNGQRRRASKASPKRTQNFTRKASMIPIRSP
jgi:hypothetical protein